MRIYKWFTFDAAHRLPNVKTGHKCGELHGHTYQVRIDIDGDVLVRPGWVMDYGELTGWWKQAVEPKLDHRYLNDIPGLENPTAELLCLWIRDQAQEAFGCMCCRVEVKETPNTGAIWECQR